MQETNKIYFLEDFLLPSLNNNNFQEKLKWINKSTRTFQIYWPDNRKHSNEQNNDECLEVYMAWLRMKKSENNMKCKDIFRSALYSKEKDGELKRCADKGNYRIYQLTNSDIDDDNDYIPDLPPNMEEFIELPNLIYKPDVESFLKCNSFDIIYYYYLENETSEWKENQINFTRMYEEREM